MAKYKVLPSVARNYGASFISVMNMTPDDYAMCHLLRAAKRSGANELRVDLLTGAAEPTELVPPPVADAVLRYCEGFGSHVQRSGAALDIVSRAELRVRIAWGRHLDPTPPEAEFRARLHCEVRILDDRGKEHEGRTQEEWLCHPTQRYY
jgi:hypothetical protein